MTYKSHTGMNDELRAEMEAAAEKLWAGADIEISPHLANAIRRVRPDTERAAS